MIDLRSLEVWFVTGSQHLYGEETLNKVAEHSGIIARYLHELNGMPVSVKFKPVVKTPDEISAICREANAAEKCIGVIAWMHTFSPAKMWINGLKTVQKPMLHLHTQFNRDIPWSAIDMDFMNLNQSAHGDREFGFIMSRMRMNRKVVVGHWENPEVHADVFTWIRAAAAWADSQHMKVARFGDNMRQVAVTEGDKVEAEIRFGYSVNGYGLGDLMKVINETTDAEIDRLVQEYNDSYDVGENLRAGGSQQSSLRDAAKIEIGIRRFLEAGNFSAYTDTFEDLHGLTQLPGIASQRLMADGYGFGAEGDWKTAALLRTMKVMGHGLPGGNSFMEDYTYHFAEGNNQILGSHMLEICPSIAASKPRCEVHPLGIGGKADPVRLVFNTAAGPAMNVSMIDMGNRFRVLVNEVEAVDPMEDLPTLPVARVLWKPLPDMRTACASWIIAGGAHHTVYSQNLKPENIEDYASMANIEMVLIDKSTTVRDLKNELRWNELSYRQ
jgi:L-arabinose isomerase